MINYHVVLTGLNKTSVVRLYEYGGCYITFYYAKKEIRHICADFLF